jgi:tripartite ATP-independent transporter DctP family solute receptor
MSKFSKGLGKLVLALILAVTLCLLSGVSADAKEYVLKLGHDQTVNHPYDLGCKKFAENVEARTNGAIKIKIYPSAQLGDSAEQVEGLHMGTLDLSLAAFSHASAFIRELTMFGAPFLFVNDQHFANVFDGEVGKILDQACQKRYEVRLLSTFTSGYRYLFNRKRHVFHEKDLVGLKIRVMGGEADALTWKVFGAIPAPMPYSEVYSALQAGVIDGAENEPVSVLANKFYETCPHFAQTKHLVLPMGLFMSAKTLEKLPEEFQQIFFEEGQKAAAWEREFITKKNKVALDHMISKYGVMVTLVDEAAFIEKGKPIQEMVAEKFSLGDLLEGIRAATP